MFKVDNVHSEKKTGKICTGTKKAAYQNGGVHTLLAYDKVYSGKWLLTFQGTHCLPFLSRIYFILKV
jgi:hypothetical protein